MKIHAVVFDRAEDALQHWYASGQGEVIISVRNKYYLTSRADAHRLEEAGIAFAYINDHVNADGSIRTVSVPVND